MMLAQFEKKLTSPVLSVYINQAMHIYSKPHCVSCGDKIYSLLFLDLCML
jgi:hypothetical protein